MSNNTDPKIKEIEQRNESRLKHINIMTEDTCIDLHNIAYLLSEIERLQTLNESARKVLEWYGDYEGNYDPVILDKLGYLPIDMDGGERAREFLSHLKG